MPTQLKEDWIPDEKYFWINNANKHPMTDNGRSRSWVEHQLPDFKMYFCKSRGGCGKTKANWNLTLWNWVKRNWEKVDKSRHYRQEVKKERGAESFRPTNGSTYKPHYVQPEETGATIHETVKPLSQSERIAILDKYLPELNKS